VFIWFYNSSVRKVTMTIQHSADKPYRLSALRWSLPKTANYFHVRMICHVGKYWYTWLDCRILLCVHFSSFDKQLPVSF